jgi:hypothetical protein
LGSGLRKVNGWNQSIHDQLHFGWIFLTNLNIYNTGVELTVSPEIIELVEGAMSQFCISVNDTQPAHERNIDLDFSATFGNIYTGA